MAKAPPIEQTYYYAARPSEVFAALTEPDRLATWFLDSARISLKKGGSFRFVWQGGYSIRGKVKKVDPEKLLVLAWIDRFESGKVFETEARFDLEKKGKGTLLTVTHRGFKKGPKWVQLYGAIQSGWAHYLTNLRSVLEHDTDLRSPHDVPS
jgi:uncharacterized protein YndB with AHSA1/START domain